MGLIDREYMYEDKADSKKKKWNIWVKKNAQMNYGVCMVKSTKPYLTN